MELKLEDYLDDPNFVLRELTRPDDFMDFPEPILNYGKFDVSLREDPYTSTYLPLTITLQIHISYKGKKITKNTSNQNSFCRRNYELTNSIFNTDIDKLIEAMALQMHNKFVSVINDRFNDTFLKGKTIYLPEASIAELKSLLLKRVSVHLGLNQGKPEY